MKQFWAKKNEHWAIVPCPKILESVVQSSDVLGDIPACSATQVAEHAASFSPMEIVRSESGREVCLVAEICDDRGRLRVEMILQGDDEFGGFSFHGKFDIRLLLEFWEHLQNRFAQLRVFDSRDLCLYSVDALKRLHCN